MDHKVLHGNFVECTAVLGYNCNTGSVHFVRCRILIYFFAVCFLTAFYNNVLRIWILSSGTLFHNILKNRNILTSFCSLRYFPGKIIFIWNLQIMNPDIFRIVKKNCGGYISLIYMRRGIQSGTIILIPDSRSVCTDMGQISFPVRCNLYQISFLSFSSDMKILVFKNRTSFQQNTVACTKFSPPDLVQSSERSLLCQTVICIFSVNWADIICCGFPFHIPSPVFSF